MIKRQSILLLRLKMSQTYFELWKKKVCWCFVMFLQCYVNIEKYQSLPLKFILKRNSASAWFYVSGVSCPACFTESVSKLWDSHISVHIAWSIAVNLTVYFLLTAAAQAERSWAEWASTLALVPHSSGQGRALYSQEEGTATWQWEALMFLHGCV